MAIVILQTSVLVLMILEDKDKFWY